MEQGGDRPDDEVSAPDAESPESWYFDLPSGAWERQEEKNRELRRRVQSNIDEEPERIDPFVRKQDPEKTKGGRFGFGRKKNSTEEAPHETAGGTFRLQRGGAASFGTLPPQTDDADDWSTEPDVPIALPHRAHAPNEPVEEPGSYIEADEGKGTRWDATFGIESEDTGEDEEDNAIAGMRAWATKHEATERRVPFAQRLHVIPREQEADDGDTSPLGAEDAVAPVVDVVEEAPQPVAPVFEPPKLGFVRRAAVEEVAEEVSEDGEESRWNQMFKGADDGGSEGLAAMAEWAKKKAEEESDEPREIPEEFLKPFDWEQDGTTNDEIADTPDASADAVEAEAVATTGAFVAEVATPDAEVPTALEQADDTVTEAATIPEPAAAMASFAEALAAVAQGETDVEPEQPKSFEWERDDATPVAQTPVDAVAEAPIVTRVAEEDSAWDDTELFPETPQAVVGEPKREARKPGLLGRIFGRKKADVQVEPEPVPSLSGGDWVPMDESPSAPDAKDERSANPFADAASLWAEDDNEPSAFVQGEAPEDASEEKWQSFGEDESVFESEVESAPLPLLRPRQSASEGLRDLPNDSFAWGAASEPAPVAEVSVPNAEVTEQSGWSEPESPEVAEAEASVEPETPLGSWQAAPEDDAVAIVEVDNASAEAPSQDAVSVAEETPGWSWATAEAAQNEQAVATVEPDASADPAEDAVSVAEETSGWAWATADVAQNEDAVATAELDDASADAVEDAVSVAEQTPGWSWATADVATEDESVTTIEVDDASVEAPVEDVVAVAEQAAGWAWATPEVAQNEDAVTTVEVDDASADAVEDAVSVAEQT
ncbi:MAG: hypothetical protein ABI305_06935, partial [Tepidiformaceae bacterium]